MAVKISDLTSPRKKFENEYQVVQASLWQKDGKALGWTYECVLPKFRFEKINIRVESEAPIIMKETLNEEGTAIVQFDNLMITPWGRVNEQPVSHGLTAIACKATLVPNK